MDHRGVGEQNRTSGTDASVNAQKDGRDSLMSPEMSSSQAYERLCVLAKEIAALHSVIRLLQWDQKLMLPKAGLAYRTDQLTWLTTIAHQKAASAEIGRLLAIVESSGLAADQTGNLGVNIREIRREYDRETRLPEELVSALSRAEAEGHAAWLDARDKCDFRAFSPTLKKTLDLTRQAAEAWGYAQEPYDALLEGYEPGLTSEEAARLLEALSRELVPLLQAITATRRRPKVMLDKGPYPADGQDRLCSALVKRLGLDRDFVRMDGADVAFCEAIGPGDIRIVARFNEKDFREAFFGCFHEAGHALYHAGLEAGEFGLPTGTCSSYAVRESQARLWENLVGHSPAFWAFWFPLFKEAFAQALDNVELDDFMSWVNQVTPSFIRVDADEVTYNLHIVLRLELERDLFRERLAVDDIPEAWNARFAELFGLAPSNPLEGCLQDVHWSWGSFGYFPTYALGNVYAAQFYDRAGSDLSDLDSQLRAGEYGPLRQWLKENVHRHGQRFDPKDLVQHATGQPPSPKFLIRQLWDRYGEVYGIRHGQT